ncbi:hypothetical protein SAMN05661091_5334 [Paenibacillus uliginis N3/975]|uniref:Cardiolipin synthase N-terminal domain-containing protein n=1 Tax=Paenibacillus uliginis N3/975 TaxID=1313296 RepID=A0A1X7HRJ8_9BACL|nr:PLDc N-terminal domain-containing protein [Paenibacillus uliginis]SMF91051.1 hypothetical protein SAMN05661091_5334 [Paenibacillus uliginis N3/975]
MAIGFISIFGIFALLIPFMFFILHIAICVWGFRDARRRGRSSEYALLVVLGLLFFPVVGVIVYLLIRDY